MNKFIQDEDQVHEDEEQEELQDYSYLLNQFNGTFKVDRSKESLPIGDLNSQKEALTKSLGALVCILSEERRGLLEKNMHCIYHSNGLVTCSSPKGSFLKSMGRTIRNILHLNHYETLYLLERASIILYKENSNAPMSLQEAYHELLCQDGQFETYQVYSYLKRLGYMLLDLQWSCVNCVNANLPCGSPMIKFTSWPLIQLGLYSSSKNALRDISIISTLNLSSQYHPSSRQFMGFNVFKPRPKFKKSCPPSPDFRVLVYSSSRHTLPDLNDFLYLKSQGNVRLAIVDGSNISFIQIQ